MNDMYDMYKKENEALICEMLKTSFPDIEINALRSIYKKCISIKQGSVCETGKWLEQSICNILKDNNINYKTQVSVDEFGDITGFDVVGNKRIHMSIIDIVVGSNIEIGTNISSHIVISCKVSCRERWLQDCWTFNIKPKKYILVTLSNDYPASERFKESKTRFILTSNPKKSDSRKFKYGIDDLVKVVTNQIKSNSVSKHINSNRKIEDANIQYMLRLLRKRT